MGELIRRGPVVIMPERVNLVFSSYEDGMKAFEVTVLANRLAREMGASTTFSYDNDDMKAVLLSFEGPETIVRTLVDILGERGINFAIDATASDEPDIVARKQKNIG